MVANGAASRLRGGDNVGVESEQRDVVFIEMPVKPLLPLVPVLCKGSEPPTEASPHALCPRVQAERASERSRKHPSAPEREKHRAEKSGLAQGAQHEGAARRPCRAWA